jgi:hypothetical protein
MKENAEPFRVIKLFRAASIGSLAGLVVEEALYLRDFS